jgi:hypothetical protein
MSHQAFTWVLEESRSTLGARLVLLSIASHANREGHNAWPSVETIALEARVSRRDVFYCLKSLEESGELVIVRGAGRGNVNHYELPCVAQWVQDLHLLQEKKRCKTPLEKVQDRTKKGETVAPEPFPNRNTLEPSLENQTAKSNLSSSGEPSKTENDAETEAELNRLKSGRALKRLARKKSIPKPKSWEDQKAELRKRGYL